MKLIVELQKRIRQLNDEEDKGIDHTAPVEIRVGYPPELLEDLPGPLNTQARSRTTRRTTSSGCTTAEVGDWKSKVMWDESGFEADDKTMGVRDVLAHLQMFDFDWFRSNQPVMGYSSKAKVSVEYRRALRPTNGEPESDRLTRLAPLLRDILALSETIQVEGVGLYNDYKKSLGTGGAGAAIGFIKKKAPRGEGKKNVVPS
jgi:hypothetical protein